ncbi:MAG: hypothetical protein K2Y39_28105 [Candidatus Obscuribacterales bacterium]|nr:hypothetical protein [Candidatus Obscuribacterales bacterium]
MKFSRRQLAKRDARGSMLFLCIAVLAVMLVVVGVVFSIYLVFFSHQHLQSRAEDLALECARQLNENDHGGKINNLIGHSRELVFTSRELYQRTGNDEFRGLQGLAAQVLEQSRSGAVLLCQERTQYVDVSLQKLRKIVKSAETNKVGSLFLSKFTSGGGEVFDLRVGDMGQPVSNVEASSGVYNLNSYDHQQNFVKPGKQAELLVSNVNLKLPGEDSDLDFRLASLPAPVKGATAPLRLTRGKGFKHSLVLLDSGQERTGICAVIPSAVQVTMTMSVKQSVVGEFDSKTRTVNTACANGAWTEP